MDEYLLHEEEKKETNHSKPRDPNHIRTWVPIFTPANVQTWPTLYPYQGDRESHLGPRAANNWPDP